GPGRAGRGRTAGKGGRMKHTDRTPRQVALDEAAEWHVVLQEPELGEAELHAWSRWMEASPENARAFEDISRLWEAAGQLDDAAVVRARAEAGAQVSAAAAPPDDAHLGTHSSTPRRAQVASRRPRRRSALGWAAGLAAVLVVACAAWLLGRQAPPAFDERVVSTAIGERRQLQLGDGSTVDLDAASEVVVRFTGDARGVTLLRGR